MPGNGALGYPTGQAGEWSGIRCIAGSDAGPPGLGSWSRASIDRQLGMCFLTGSFVLSATISSGEVTWGTLPVPPAALGCVVGGERAISRDRVYLGTGVFNNTASAIIVLMFYRPSDKKIVMCAYNNNNEVIYTTGLNATAVLHYNLAYAI